MDERSLLLWHGPELVWNELRRILGGLPALRLVGATARADEALALAARHQPDVIIAPAHHHGSSLLPTVATLQRDASPRSKCILFATDCAPADFIGPVEAWLVGYLEWPGLPADLLHHCLTALIWGDVVLGTRGAIRAFAAAQRGDRDDAAGMPRLGATDRAILDGLCDGLTNAELAKRLGCNVSTIKRHIASLEASLGASDRFTLAMQAMRHGLLR